MFSIAIDGPAGAGKSTIAKLVAKELEIAYLDTGALYRGIGYYLNEKKVDVLKEEKVKEAIASYKVQLDFEEKQPQIYVNDSNVTAYLRTEEVGNIASKIATYSCIREKLLSVQQETAKKMDVVMDGRDIGTNVLPNANLKIYLTASVSERANRRYKELVEKGESCDIAKIEADIKARDKQDMQREIAPLRQAEDAILIDSSQMTIDEVVEQIVKEAKERKE